MEQMSSNQKLGGLLLAFTLVVSIYWFGFRKPTPAATPPTPPTPPMPPLTGASATGNATSNTTKGAIETAQPQWIAALMLDKGWEAALDKICQGKGVGNVNISASGLIKKTMADIAKNPIDNEWAHPPLEKQRYFVENPALNEQINHRVTALFLLVSGEKDGNWFTKETAEQGAVLFPK